MSLAWPGNITFSGTVSAPLFVSNQQIIAPFAAGTASTLTLNSLSSNFGSLSTVYTSTLSVGTILNFSAGGSIGTNLTLTGTLITNSLSSAYASFTSGIISTITSSRLISGPALFNGSVSLASTAPLIGVATANPGDMLVTTAYTNPMDRYGIGQYTNNTVATTRFFTSGYLGTNASLALSIAGSGSTAYGTFTDVLTIRSTAAIGTLSSTGNVGINNTSPFYTLDIIGTARVSGSISSIGNGNSSSQTAMLNISGTNSSVYIYAHNDQNQYFQFSNNLIFSPVQQTNVKGLAISSSGLVGINTASPLYGLDVSGSTRVTSGLIVGTTLDNISLTLDALTGNAPSNRLGFVKQAGFPPKMVAATTTSIILGISTGSDLTQNIATSTITEGFRLHSNGFVGINNSTPSYQLDVSGLARLNNAFFASLSNSMMILNQSQAGTSSTNFSLYQGTAGDTVLNSASGLPLEFKIGNVEYARLSSAGLFGINTTSPSYNLDVAGSCRILGTVSPLLNVLSGVLGSATNTWISLGGAQTTNNSGFVSFLSTGGSGSSNNFLGLGIYGQNGFNSPLAITGNAQVGINNTSPSYTFDVSGSARVTGSLTVGGNISSNASSKSYLYNAGIISNYPGTVTDVGVGNIGMIFTYPAILDLVNGNNTSMLRISGNYVGINNTTPSYTLDVAGTVRVTGTSVLTQSAWIAVTFQNSFGNLGALPQTQCAYMKDSMGFVHLQGLLWNASAANTTAFTLPAGYRTTTYRNFLVATSGSTINANVFLPPGGNVNVNIAANQWVDLGLISFLADS